MIWMRRVGLVVLLGVVALVAGLWVGLVLPRAGATPDETAAGSLGALPTPATAGPAQPARPAFAALQSTLEQILRASGTNGGVTISELEGQNPQTWSLAGDEQFLAASTYKLPLLMLEAQNVAAGKAKRTDRICFQDSDAEDGWFDDYDAGTCMSRADLDRRIGQQSDNTAAHMVVRVNGGGNALNAYAGKHGARQSDFYDPNVTTTSDLARLWVDEAQGRAGGRPAQQYLFPLLTKTAYESGIPAGVPRGTTVVHKIGSLDDVVNDAALIPRGPRGAYVLAICTEGPGGDAGWKVLADISRAVWQFEAAR